MIIILIVYKRCYKLYKMKHHHNLGGQKFGVCQGVRSLRWDPDHPQCFLKRIFEFV